MSAASQGGWHWDIFNTIIGGADVEITYPQPTRSVMLHSRNNQVLQWRKSENAVEYATFYPGDPVSMNIMLANALANESSYGWIRTQDGGPDVIEGVVTY